MEVPGLKPRVLEADAVAEAGEEGAGGVLLSSVAVPFPARGRGYRGAPPQVLLDSVAGLAVVAEAQARDAAVVVERRLYGPDLRRPCPCLAPVEVLRAREVRRGHRASAVVRLRFNRISLWQSWPRHGIFLNLVELTQIWV